MKVAMLLKTLTLLFLPAFCHLEKEVEPPTAGKNYNFVIEHPVSSLDLHFDFRPKTSSKEPGTSTEHVTITTTEHPSTTTTEHPVTTTVHPKTTTGHPSKSNEHSATTEHPVTTTAHPETTTGHPNKSNEHSSTTTEHYSSTAEHPKTVTEHDVNHEDPANRNKTHELPPKPVKGPSNGEKLVRSKNNTSYADSPLGYEVPCGIRGRNTNGTQRIVNGTNAVKGEFPWMVSIQLKSGLSWRHICGGAILSKYHVITAGHCVHKLPLASLSVVAGDYDLYEHEGQEQRRGIERIQGLKGFAQDNFTKDIALLQLEPYLEMDGTWVAPICLPRSNRHFPPGQRGLIAGWGRLSERGSLANILQRTSLPLIKYDHCKEIYSKAGYSKYLHSCQICGGWEEGSSDTCQGDSGGPLACKGKDGKYYLCGIVSWGIGCARPKYPGVYTDVSCYSQWIADFLYIKPSALSLAIDL